MFSETFAAIANGFSGMAGGPFVDGTLWWAGTATMDSGGSITAAGTPVEQACRVQVDVATEAMRNDADFQQNDVRLIILASGLSRFPDEAAELTIEAGVNAGRYALQSATRDPVGVGFECRARLMPGETS